MVSTSSNQKKQLNRHPSKVDSKYGAPMGRPTYDETGGKPTRCRMTRLVFVDGDYDRGGAYWGSPADVYWLRDADDTVQAFTRASSRAKAAEQLMSDFPNVLIRGFINKEA